MERCHIRLNRWVLPEVVIYYRLSLCPAHANILRQAESALPVYDPEIHRFCCPTHILGHRAFLHAIYFCSCGGMYVFLIFKGLNHILIAAYRRHYAQLYLRIVGAYELVALLAGYEGLPYLPPTVRAYGYILQVRVIAAQAARYGHSLVVAGVQPARLRVYKRR